MAPTLTVSPTLDLAAIAARERRRRRDDEDVEGARDRLARMKRDGFFRSARVTSFGRCERIRAGIESLRRTVGGHEIFALLYDEPWTTLAENAWLVEQVFGEPPH